MENQYPEGTLPCLQSMDEIWTKEDRLKLFFYLDKVFHLGKKYFVSLTQKNMHGSDNVAAMTEQDLLTCEQSITDVPKKVTCAYLRNVNFSFGCLNKHLCYICPYSGVYKNMYEEKEKLLLFYNLYFDNLEQLLRNASVKVDKVICSYFPVYVKGVLRDAIPLSIIAEVLTGAAGLISYMNDPDSFNEQRLYMIAQAMNKRSRAQLRRSPYYLHDQELYAKCALDEVKRQYMEIVGLDQSQVAYLNPIKPLNKLTVVDRKMEERNFHAISTRGRYVPKKPEEYALSMCCEKEVASVDDFFQQVPEINVFEKVMDQEKVDPEETVEYFHIDEDNSDQEQVLLKESDAMIKESEEHASDVPEKAQNQVVYEDNSILTTDIESALDLENGKNLDEISFFEFQKMVDSMDGVELAEGIEMKTDKKINLVPEHPGGEIASLPVKEKVPGWKYIISDTDLSGKEGKDMIDQSRYYCMEIVVEDKVEGVLLMTDKEHFYYYPAELYGNKPLVRIVRSGKNIYSTDAFKVSSYLHKVHVYGAKVKDLSIASEYANRSVTDIIACPLEQRMKTYADSYKSVISIVTEETKIKIQRMEDFSSLLTSDGMKPPFRGLEKLYERAESLKYESLFRATNVPEKQGCFYWSHVDTRIPDFVSADLETIYQDICIRLDQYLNFGEGKAFILNVDRGGILFYITGNEMFQEDAEGYIKACTRRVIRERYGVNCNFDTEILYQKIGKNT